MLQTGRTESGIGEGGKWNSRLIGGSGSADADAGACAGVADGLVPPEAAPDLDSCGVKIGGRPYVYPAEAEVPVPA